MNGHYISVSKLINKKGDPVPHTFTLTKRKNTNLKNWRYIAIADTHGRYHFRGSNVEYVSYWRDTAIAGIDNIFKTIPFNNEKIQPSDVVVMVLGDIVWDDIACLSRMKTQVDSFYMDPSLAPPCTDTWFAANGNHDLDYDRKGIFEAGKTNTPGPYAETPYQKVFGPTDYSFNVGDVHIITMDNIYYMGKDKDKNKLHKYTFDDRQLEWLRKDLSYVPAGSTVIFNTHAPIWGADYKDRNCRTDSLLKQFKGFDVHLFNGHMHNNSHYQYSNSIYQHNVASAGRWNHPIDGSPRGCEIVDIKDGKVSHWIYKGFQMDLDEQMRIYAPGEFAYQDGYVVANVWGRDNTEDNITCSFNDGAPVTMKRFTAVDQNAYGIGKQLPSYNLFRAKVPDSPKKATVTFTNRFGETYTKTIILTAGQGTTASPYTVDDVLNLYDNGKHKAKTAAVWVKGYIVGYVPAKTGDKYIPEFGNNATANANVIISSDPNAKDEQSPFLTVQLPEGAIRNAVNLKDHPDNYGREICVLGMINTAGYLGHTGVKSTSDYRFSGIGEFQPSGGIYRGPLQLNIVPDAGYTIHYTTDNSKPTANSPAHSSAINIDRDITVNAIGVGSNSKEGGTASQTYTIDPSKEGTWENPYTVADVLKQNPTSTTPTANQPNVWVKGYIVGWMVRDATTKTSTYAFSTRDAITPNILIADDPDCDDWEQCIPVQLNNVTYIRPALNLKYNPRNIGKEVKVCGLMLNYLARPGIRDTKLYAWTDTSGNGTSISPYTVEDVNKLYETGEHKNVTDEVWVKGFINGYSYRIDSSSYGYRFGTTAGAGVSNVIIGASASAGEDEPFLTVQLPAGRIRNSVNLQDHPENFGKELMVFGKINSAGYLGHTGVKETTDYILPGTTDITDGATVDENAPVEYYNLQGIRVYNPSKGIYIMRQGNKVTKVLK